MGFAVQNPEYPISVYGRWFELIKAASAPVIPIVPMSVPAGNVKDDNLASLTLPSQALNPDTATAQWFLTSSLETVNSASNAAIPAIQTQPDSNTTTPPTQSDFKVPTNQVFIYGAAS